MEARYWVGGSNIAGICGLSPFSSPLQEYLKIIGEAKDIDPEQERFFKRRKFWEPYAAECFELSTGMRVVERNHRYPDPVFDWMKAEIDAEVEPHGERENVESKSVHHSVAWMWGDPDEGEQPPFYVTAQAMHGLGVTGRQKCYVHALIGFDDERIYEVHRHEETIDKLRRRADRFWRYNVLAKNPPAPMTLADINALYPRDTGRQVEADTEIQMALTERDKSVRAIKQHENQKELLDLQIKKYMRDATALTVGGMTVATWKQRTDGVRVFRIK